MTKNKLKALTGSVILASMIGGLALPAYAQTSTTTTTNNPGGGTSITTYYSTSTAPGSTPQSTITATTTQSTSTTTATTTPVATSTSTTTGGVATSTLSIQNRIALLQTQAIVLFGRIIMNISAQATSTPALTGPVNQLKQAWIGLALNHLSVIRARLGL
jgi:hypothetical protein